MTPPSLSGFEIIEELGTGGMATVWKARQVSLDRIVAIKILASGLSTDPDDVRRFQSEAQAAARLKHPGIVQVYDANVEDGTYYFVMEYVAGYTVGDWIRRKGRLSEKDALLVAECTADALAYAWDHAAIIHCDIKPDNLIIDADGTVKVADLGLSRTISAMTSEPSCDDIMGTPAYMSPEQAGGVAQLDCRTDIYALGAMLFHILTGRLLFKGEPDDRVIEMQVSGRDVDPIDEVPELSGAMCWFIEKLLAKDPSGRPRDWGEVSADVARVKKGMKPHRTLPAEGKSTVKRSPKRRAAAGPRTVRGVRRRRPVYPRTRTRHKRFAALLVTLAILALSALVIHLGRKSVAPPPRVPLHPAVTGGHRGSAHKAALLENARTMFEAAQRWAAANPTAYEQAVRQLRNVAEETVGTPYAAMAREEVRRISAAHEAAVADVLDALAREAGGLIERREYGAAAELYHAYNGRHAEGTRAARFELTQALREQDQQAKAEAQQREREVARLLKEGIGETAIKTLEEGPRAGIAVLDRFLADPAFEPHHEDIVDLRAELSGAARTDDRILDTFRAARGQELTVSLVTGSKRMTIDGVRDGRVYAHQVVDVGSTRASVALDFSLADLDVGERMSRLGGDDARGVALFKGLMAYDAHSYDLAQKYFAMSAPMLGDILVPRVDIARKAYAETRAERALAQVLNSLKLNVGAYDEAAWRAAVAACPMSPEREVWIRDTVREYRLRFGDSEFCTRAAPVLEDLLARRTSVAPVSRSGGRGPALDGDGFIAAILAANPDVMQEAIDLQVDSEGTPFRLSLISPALQDISAVGGLHQLRELTIGSYEPHRDWTYKEPCNVRDLSCLIGLPLETLNVCGTRVRDISPLKALPLVTCGLMRTPVDDIGPLRQMRLESLNLSHTSVKDLTPLRALPLRELNLAHTRIHDFRALRGLALSTLDVSGTQLRDLSILSAMPLESLNIAGSNVSTLSALRGMQLERLDINGTSVRDLTPLAGMPLATLIAHRTPVTSLAPLTGLKLSHLDIGHTRVRDLSPVKDCPLRVVSIEQCAIETLDDLAAMPLRHLIIAGTQVRDLTPLTGSSVAVLEMHDTPIRDLKPLTTMPNLSVLNCRGVRGQALMPLRGLGIKKLWIGEIKSSEIRRLLRSMPNLVQVNGVAW